MRQFLFSSFSRSATLHAEFHKNLSKKLTANRHGLPYPFCHGFPSALRDVKESIVSQFHPSQRHSVLPPLRYWGAALMLVAELLILCRQTPSHAEDLKQDAKQTIPRHVFDEAIVASLTARLEQQVEKSNLPLNVQDRKKIFAFVAGPSDRKLTIKVDPRNYVVVYTGDCATFLKDGRPEVETPQPGVIIKPLEAIQVADVVIGKDELLLRTAEAWVVCSTEQMVEALRTALTTIVPAEGDNSIKEARRRRAIGAAGAALLGKDAEPLTADLLALIREKQLDSDEVVGACEALANLGGPEVTKALSGVRSRVKDHVTMRDAVTEAIKQVRKVNGGKQNSEPLLPKDVEQMAEKKLDLARGLIEKNPRSARKRLEEIVKDFQGTSAAKEAEALLKDKF